LTRFPGFLRRLRLRGDFSGWADVAVSLFDFGLSDGFSRTLSFHYIRNNPWCLNQPNLTGIPGY
jgi:hypothetical protein